MTLGDGCMFPRVNVPKYSQGVDSSLETKMTCVGRYEIKPPIYEKFIEKKMYT